VPNRTALMPTDVGHLAAMDPLELSLAGFLARYKGGTFREYRHDMRVYFDWCARNGLHPLQAKRPHLELYVRWLEQTGLAPATIARRYGTVAVYYRVAAMDELIQRDPCLGVTRPKVDWQRQRRTVLNDVQYAALLTAARNDSPTAHALVALLGLRGLRIAEACSLNVESMGVRSGYDTVRFIGKGDKYAEVTLPVPVMRAVRECIGDRTAGPILTTRTGARMDRSAARRLLRRLARQAGVPEEISPHTLRRTFATSAFRQGIPAREIQSAMRHANLNTTVRYDVRGDNPDRDAAHRLAGHLAGMTD
jgi:integrase/recombinase XerD